MDEFTKAEIERINQLYGNDFEGITPDDAKLIGRWEAQKAANSEIVKAQTEAIRSESKARVKQSEELHKIAKSNLETLHDAAVARWEAVKNVKQEQAKA